MFARRGRKILRLADGTYPAAADPDVATSRITPPRVNEPTVWIVPARAAVWAARINGWRDGRRGLHPDPDSGHYAYTEGLEAAYRSAVANQEKLLSAPLSANAELDQAFAEEQRQLRQLIGAHVPAAEPVAAAGETLDARRARRAAHTDWSQQQHQQQTRTARLAEIGRHRARLAEQRAFQIALTDQHHEAARQHWQQLAAEYWKWLLRTHPESDDLRRAYHVPTIRHARIDSVAHHIPGATTTPVDISEENR